MEATSPLSPLNPACAPRQPCLQALWAGSPCLKHSRKSLSVSTKRSRCQVLATRAAQQALAAGRVVLLRRGSGSGGGGSGITELGVICGDAPEASSSGGGSSLGGPGSRGLGALLGGSSSGGSAAGAGAESGSSGGGRRYTVLYLHRPSPLDPAPQPAAAADGQQPAGALGLPAAAALPPPPEGGPGGLPGEPMMRLKKKASPVAACFGPCCICGPWSRMWISSKPSRECSAVARRQFAASLSDTTPNLAIVLLLR